MTLPQIKRSWAEARDAAIEFDRLGFDSVWVCDHLYGVPLPSLPILEAWTELAGTENRIATERRRYNEVVQEYNTLTKSFPTVITAKALGFGEQKYFEAPESAKQVPQVKF